LIWLTCKLKSDHIQIDPTNSTAISLNGLTIGADHFLVICNSLAANYSWSGYPIGTCDKTASTGGPADSNGDDQIAIASCTTGCANFTILDIYGVPGQQGNNTNGHLFQYGRAERVAGRVTPKSVWNASDWISVFGNATVGFGLNAIDMTPRKWSAVAVSPTSKPSSRPTTVQGPSDFPSTDRSVDWIAFDWGFFTIAGVILVAGLAIVFICRLRHKIVLRKLDLDSYLQLSSDNIDMAVTHRCVDRKKG